MKPPITPQVAPDTTVAVPPALHNVVTACPLAGDNPPDCVLHDLRPRGSTEVTRWLAALSSEEQQFLLSYHECCLAVQIDRLLFGGAAVAPPAPPAVRPAAQPKPGHLSVQRRKTVIRHCTPSPALSR